MGTELQVSGKESPVAVACSCGAEPVEIVVNATTEYVSFTGLGTRAIGHPRALSNVGGDQMDGCRCMVGK